MKYYAYVYSYDRVPFYVGKGRGNRANDHINFAKKDGKFANEAFGNKVKSIITEGRLPEVEKFYCENEEEAFSLEQFFITEIGRIDLGTGTLFNLTDGGLGMRNYILSNEHKAIISKSNSERELSEAVLNNFAGWNKGVATPDEVRMKQSIGNKGKKRTPEQRENYRRAAQNRTKEHSENISKALKAKKALA